MPEILGKTYMRVFEHAGMTYAMAMPGQFYRSVDGLTGFEEGPLLFNPDMRHAAMLKRGDTLYVFWTQVGQVPERILLSTIDLSGDWMSWKSSEPTEVLRPERDWEGAHAPLEPSVRSTAYGQVNQLRDPAIYVEEGRVYLLYAVAGESGIGPCGGLPGGRSPIAPAPASPKGAVANGALFATAGGRPGLVQLAGPPILSWAVEGETARALTDDSNIATGPGRAQYRFLTGSIRDSDGVPVRPTPRCGSSTPCPGVLRHGLLRGGL